MASRYPGCREGGGPAMSVGGVVYTVLSDYGLQDPEGPRAPGRSSSTSDACRSLRVSFDGRAGEATQFPRTIPALGVAAVLVACLLILERRGQLGSLPVASSGQGRGHPVTGEVALESVYEAGKVQMLQIGSCRTKGLAPINERGGCLAAAKALHVLLNDTNLRTTDLADVPEGCYYCHNFVDGTYTLWLGTGAGSRGKGAETSQPTKTRQPICTEQATAGKFSTPSPSAASTKSGKPDCDQGFSDWKTGWSGAKKAWCCKAHRRGCETTQTTMAIPTTSPRSSIPVRVASIKVGGPAEWWEVIARGGLVVRSGECSSCRAIGTKARYDVVRARRHGDWLQLASELGFVLLRRNGQTFLRRAKPYHMIRIVNGKCSTLGREPIRNQDDCNKAAKALGLAITSASVTTDKPRPEGCYYFEHHGEESLWLSTAPDNVGHGASIKPGSQRMPLCGLPGAASASPAPAPAAPTPAPASTTAAPTLAHPALSEKEKAWEESKREAEESKRKAHPALSEKEKAWEESKREAEESKREAASRTTSSAATAVDLGGVTIFMTVQNVEFNRLIDTPNLASVIVSAIKRAVLFMVDDPSVNEDHIQVTLSSGSVKVAATVRPPASVDAGSLRSKLSTRAPYACKALAADLTGVRAIYAVSTGKVTVGDIKVLGAPGLSTVSVTTTTMSTTTTQMTTSTRTTMTSTGTSTSTSSRTSSSTTTTRTTTTSSATSTTTATNTATSTSTTSSTSSSTTTTTTSTHSTTTSTSTERTTVAPTTTTQEGATTTLATTSTTAHLVPARVTAAPTTTTTRVHWDCGGKDTEVRLWTLEQQGWCCTHHNRGCFDCHAGRSHWEVGWAPKKRDWCCKAYGVGCDYDCSQGQPWSQQRKVWCCLHKNIGCSDRASTVTVLQANPTPAPVAREGVPASGQGGSQGNVDVNWNCYDGEEVHWRSEKQDWCCLHRNKGCIEKPFDCRAELETWQVSWSQRKVDWCCRFEQMGCPLYDCGVGLANAEAAWSDGKKAWCCRTQRLGCPKPYNCHDGMENYFVHWSEEKRRWCCTNEQLGCVQPYNCQASADLWESGWSSRKKAWCCEHMKVCPRLWDCHGGADNWEVEWGKAQQAWCCRHHAIGCGYKCALPSTTWSFRERQWCCQYRGIECAGSSSAQFRAV